jgi:dTDP-4-dehydrorhamnose reductase
MMNKNLLITGSNGQLGQEIKNLSTRYPSLSFTFVDIETLDLTDKTAVAKYLTGGKFDTLVNCAAYTAVDKAETDSALCYAVNHQAVDYLTEICQQTGTQIIHVSTDYVFDGSKHTPYIETDPENPLTIYGKSKLAGEKAALSNRNSLVIRTSWLYSAHGNNFVKTMIRLGKEREEVGVIFDQVGTPTYAADLAAAILSIVDQSPNASATPGIYHFSNEGVCSWYDLAVEIFSLAKYGCKAKPIETSEYPSTVKRPYYSVLNKKKIKQTFELTIPHWRDGLIRCLKQLHPELFS